MGNEITFPSIVSTRRVVPNEHPIREPDSYRIAIVGEAPGEDEENHRRPFVGRSGQFLTNILQDVGIDRTKCLMGNVCQFRPPGNRIEAFDWNGPEITEGLAKLNEDIRVYNPNLVVCLGNIPLRAARGPCKITDWRGSLFTSQIVDGPFSLRKCIGSLHPAFVLREFSGFPLLKFDLKRAADEGKSPELILPKRELITDLDADTLVYIMDTWPAGQRCSVDIEGGLGGWPCVSICARPTKSITIAWGKFQDQSTHGRVLQSFARLMYRGDVPKVLQNSLYDNFVLSYGYGIPVRNVVEDTMLKGWEVYCELPKGLGTQTSIWTREPFYKAERKSDDVETFYQYCAKDSAVTLEICNNQDNVLTGASLQHYRKNIEMLNPALYMELRGIRYDKQQADERMVTAQKEVQPIGDDLCKQVGFELRGPKGFLVPQRLMKALYDTLKCPQQTKKTFVDRVKTETETSDQEAMLKLFRQCRTNPIQSKFIQGVLAHKRIESRIKQLRMRTDQDGRVRAAYNIVGTETGRFSCRKSPTGSGNNLQTQMPELRDLLLADEGYDFFQCDLSGADGWTVAAHCKRLGDPVMFDDYQFGLKPAHIIGLLYYFGAEVNQLTRDDLKFWSKHFKIIQSEVGDWFYLGCKRVQHGSNYMMGVPTMQVNVMKDSYKKSLVPTFMEHRDGTRLQQLYFVRYRGIGTLHSWAESKLVADGTLVSASGQKRIFFGRRFGTNIHDTVKEFLAHEPQSNTTFVTNSAMLNLWNDSANRVGSYVGVGSAEYIRRIEQHLDREQIEYMVKRTDYGALYIEPLHQVHDALCDQAPQIIRPWARKKHFEYFNNPLTIAGIDIVIPFEGKFGKSWGELENDL